MGGEGERMTYTENWTCPTQYFAEYHTREIYTENTPKLCDLFSSESICACKVVQVKSLQEKKKKGYRFGKNLWNVQSFNDLSLNFIQFQHHNQNNIHHSGDVIVETSVLTLKYWSVNCYINFFSCLKQPRGLLNRD